MDCTNLMDESGRHGKASLFLGSIQYLIWLTLAQELTDGLESPSLVCQLSRRFTASLLPSLLHLGLDIVVWQLSPCSTELSHFLSWGFFPQKIIAYRTWSWSLSQRTWTITICYLKFHDNIIRHRRNNRNIFRNVYRIKDIYKTKYLDNQKWVYWWE